jgi:hypothetical protein
VDYGQVIGRTFPILGRHRYLLLLAVLGGGEFGGASFSSPGFQSSSTESGGGAAVDPATILTLLAVVLGGLAVLLVAWFVLSLITTPALIRAAAEHDAQRPFGLGPALRTGLQSAWKVFVLRLLLVVAVALVFLAASLPILGPAVYLIQHAGDEDPGRALAAMIGGIVVSVLLLIALAVLVLLPLGVVVELALRSVVLELTGPFQALGRGFHLLTHRFGRVALTWLISVGFGLAAGMIAGLVTTPLILLVTLGSTAFASGPGGTTSGLVLSLAGSILLLVLVAGVNGVLGGFFSVYWTLAFRRLDLQPQPGR